MNRPNKIPPPDIYPGLDDELNAVYERNVSEGIAVPVEKAPEAELGAVVVEQLQQTSPEALLSEDIREWTVEQLIPAKDSWARFDSHLDKPIQPLSIVGNQHKSFGEVMERLYSAKQILNQCGEKTPEDLPIGETMKLVLIPWQDFRNAIDNGVFEDWLKGVRESQGIDEEDYINEDIIAAIEEQKPFYRHPISPGVMITAKEYLHHKIAHDGDWGVMLVQTSEQAGLQSLLRKSPDELTGEGHAELAVGTAGRQCRVDGLGIFEWLALTTQEDPRQLSAKTDYSWMLANRLVVDGVPYVPSGSWYDGQVRSLLFQADNQFGYVRPRLAVL